ncbi:MAG: hypothetical protein LIO62_05615 [Clostridiales bacterium]|nr:hypothetical protein [Clostridiales bacterium]
MSNKKISVIITLFIIGFLIIVGLMSIGSKLPFIGKAIALILAVVLIIFVIIFIIASIKHK